MIAATTSVRFDQWVRNCRVPASMTYKLMRHWSEREVRSSLLRAGLETLRYLRRRCPHSRSLLRLASALPCDRQQGVVGPDDSYGCVDCSCLAVQSHGHSNHKRTAWAPVVSNYNNLEYIGIIISQPLSSRADKFRFDFVSMYITSTPAKAGTNLPNAEGWLIGIIRQVNTR